MIALPPLLPNLAPQQAVEACIIEGTCRSIGSVRIEQVDGKAKGVPVNQTLPWVAQDNVMLFPGESVTITLVERGGELAVRREGPERTSVCTLKRGTTVFKNWQFPIVHLALWHFTPTEEPGCKTLQWDKGDD